MRSAKLGIDAGGTLIKIAYTANGTIAYHSFSSLAIDDAVKWITEHFHRPAICVTGGKSQVLAERLPVAARTVVEFDATTEGITYLAEQQNVILGDAFLFVNVGTGTSIHYVKDGEQERTGGSGVGGGTMLGLAALTTGIKDYETMIQTARDGNSDNVDLKVKDIFTGSIPPLSGDLTASNFGKIPSIKASPSDPDILASVMRLVGEVIASISSRTIEQYDAKTIVFIGSSMRSNPPLQTIMAQYTRMIDRTPVFLERGEYSGAIGALLSLD